MLFAWRSASSWRRPGKTDVSLALCVFIFQWGAPLQTSSNPSGNGSICVRVYVYTLFHQEICLYSVESLTLPPSFFQLLLAVCQPSLLLPHCPLVIVVNVLQLLIRTLEDLSRKQPSALVTHSAEFRQNFSCHSWSQERPDFTEALTIKHFQCLEKHLYSHL